MFTPPVGNFAVPVITYRPSVASGAGINGGYVTGTANAYDTSLTTSASMNSSILNLGAASLSYTGFPPVVTKNATVTIVCTTLGISGAFAGNAKISNGANTLTTWTDAALTNPVTYAIADGINMANLSVSFNAESSKVAHAGKGSSIDIFNITITQ